MANITVPGVGGPDAPAYTVPAGTGDILGLAAKLSVALASISGAGTLSVTEQSVSGDASVLSPTVESGITSEVILNGAGGGSITVSAGYQAIILDTTGTSTVIGSNTFIFGNNVGGTYNVSGNSTVAATGGNNRVIALGDYLVSTSTEDDVIAGAGAGTLAGGGGSNTINGSGNNLFLSTGKDVVFAAAGNNTVLSSGSNANIFGGAGILAISVTGANATISGGLTSASVTTGGSKAVVFGDLSSAGSSLSVTDTGVGSTIVAGTGSSTITASGTGALIGAGAGSGSLHFIGGNSPATVGGFAGANETLIGGSGGIYFNSWGANATVIGGAGVVTMFGGAGGSITYNSSAGGAQYSALSGNETLNAAGSSTGNLIVGGADPFGQNRFIGGSGSDTIIAGAAAETATGGAGADIFVFFNANTTGNTNVVADLTNSDIVLLDGYGTNVATVLATATASGGNSTITLSDSTKITFLGISDLKAFTNNFGSNG